MTGYSDLWIILNQDWTFGLVIIGLVVVCGLGWLNDKIKKGR